MNDWGYITTSLGLFNTVCLMQIVDKPNTCFHIRNILIHQIDPGCLRIEHIVYILFIMKEMCISNSTVKYVRPSGVYFLLLYFNAKGEIFHRTGCFHFSIYQCACRYGFLIKSCSHKDIYMSYTQQGIYTLNLSCLCLCYISIQSSKEKK